MSDRHELLDLMRTMSNGIIAVEVLADHMVEVATELDADGQSDAAGVLRMLARQHRVRSMELQGQLGATSVIYADTRRETGEEA